MIEHSKEWYDQKAALEEGQPQHLRMLKLSDICQCGLYRSQHENYSGKGKDACQQFRFQREASAEDEKHWKQYHEPRKERRQPDDSL